MLNHAFTVKGHMKVFQMDNPWFYVAVPSKYTEMFKNDMDRGLLAVTATLGDSERKTSLMPKGDGTHFIPLSAKIRKKESLNVGDIITLSFCLRER